MIRRLNDKKYVSKLSATTATGFAHDTMKRIDFNTLDLGDNLLSAADYGFKIPRDGIYRISAQYEWLNKNNADLIGMGEHSLYIKNGSTVVAARTDLCDAASVGWNGGSLSISAVLSMSSGDIITAFARQWRANNTSRTHDINPAGIVTYFELLEL